MSIFRSLILLFVVVILLAMGRSHANAQSATAAGSQTDAASSDSATTTDDADEAQETATKKQKESDTDQFMRIRKDRKNRPVAMETSITRYEKTNEEGKRITVDLIGVVHIGEKAYYETLNKRFEQYDGLLFELVAPEGTVIPKGGGRERAGMNPIAALQQGMQSILGLEFQLEHIDYTKDNFIHADMSPTEFGESMKKNEESISKFALRAIGQSMAMQSAGKGPNNFDMLMAIMSSSPEIRMRRSFAKQMQNMDAGMVIFQGKEGSTIIDHRNAKCMQVLEREIKNGKTNLAIFYGAGHLPNMQQRLLNDFDMHRGGRSWLKAWSLEMPKK